MRRYRFGVFCKSGNVGRFAEAMRAALRTAGLMAPAPAAENAVDQPVNNDSGDAE